MDSLLSALRNMRLGEVHQVIRIGHFALMPSALAILEPRELDEWETPFSQVVSFQRSVNWWLGDAVNIGLAQHGDDFWQVVPMECSIDLLNRCAKVSKEYPVRDRVLELSWTHHFVALSLAPQLRKAALAMARENGWSSQDLRRYIDSLDTEEIIFSGREGGSAGSAD